MKVILLALCLSPLLLMGCSRGPCDYPDDRARDGSRCGNRAASVRPGGREPQTDWIWWVVIIGGAGYFIISNSASSRSPGSYSSSSMERRQESPRHSRAAPEIKTPSPETQRFLDQTKKELEAEVVNLPSVDEPTSIDKKKVIAILRMVFDYQVDPNLQHIFDSVVAQTEKMGGTPFDAAARLMMAEIGSFEGMPGENILVFVDHKTRCLHKNLHRITLHKETWPMGIMAVRKIWNLPDLD